MASAVILEKKKAQVAELSDRIKASVAGVVVDFSGINVEDDTKLRKELRENNIQYTVVKNSILKRAAEEVGMSIDESVYEGTSAIATSVDDQTAAARILNTYAEAHDNFTIKAGYVDGEVVDVDTIIKLAKLPSRETLLSMVANVFQAPIAAFARVIKAVADKKVEEGEAPAPVEEAKVEEAAPAEEAPAPAEAPAEEAKEEAPVEEAKAEETEAPAEEATEAPAE